MCIQAYLKLSIVLLSLLLLSCMVVSKRELVNILYSFTLEPQNNQLDFYKCYSIDIENKLFREHSTSPSINSSKEAFVNSVAFFMDYTEHIQAQARNLSWAKKVESRKIQDPSLSYAPLKNVTLETVNMKPVVKPIYVSHALETNNIFVSGLEPLVILYQVNKHADLQLWNNNFCSIFLFGVDEYLASNTKSIICSLLRMAAFIKQCSLYTSPDGTN